MPKTIEELKAEIEQLKAAGKCPAPVIQELKKAEKAAQSA